MKPEPIRVLVVDDTVVYRKVVSDVLNDVPGVEMVTTAANGKIALHKIEKLQPDVITLDLQMPVLDGLAVLKVLKDNKSTVGVIVLSAFSTDGAETTMKALEYGAFDFVLKPCKDTPAKNAESLRRKLSPMIQGIARTRSIRKALSTKTTAVRPRHGRRKQAVRPRTVRRLSTSQRVEIVAIGISTGGPEALAYVIPRLPADLAVPIVIVQHMPPLFTKTLANSLNRDSNLYVCEAEDGQILQRGQVYIAPGGKQMKVARVDGEHVIRITDDPAENNCRPSVDYLFRSIADLYGGRSMAVVMTGMGSDGTATCRLLKQRGARIMVQNEATCVVYGMPRRPAEEGLADIVAALDEIPEQIVRHAGQGVPASTI